MPEHEREREARDVGLGNFLRARQQEIISAWTEAARELTPARDLSGRALVDHIPAILDRIADTIAPASVDPSGLRGEEAKQHAVQRLGRGYELEEVIREYSLLRRCIVEAWMRAVGPTIDAAELMGLGNSIEQAITEAAARYSSERERVLRALDRISEAGFSANDLDSFFAQLLGATLETMAVVDTLVVLLRDGDMLRVRAAVGLEEAAVQTFSVRVGDGFAGRIAAEGRPRFSRHAAVDALVESGALRDEGVRALYGVPLSYGGEVIGVAHMGSKTAYELSEDDKLLFESMINRATLVVKNALLAVRDQASSAAARAFGRASNFTEAIGMLLPEIGGTLRWDVGAFWRVDADREILRLDRFWQAPPIDAARFEQACRDLALPRGQGLPGDTWEAGEPIYVADFSETADFPRRSAAAAAGLKTALAFPIKVEDEVLGVIELLSRSMRWSSDEGVHLTKLVAEQLGQFTGRIAAQEALRKSSAKNAAILDAALDCIISMDADGRVRGWNKAAERTFGYSTEESMGRDMADLIVPPQFRAAHRAGIDRYLTMGRQRFLDRRVEISAVRRDGEEFPVELTITQVYDEEPALFTGFVRDITQRKDAERERAHLLDQVRRREDAQRFLSESTKQLAASLDYEATLAKAAHLAVPSLADWCVVDFAEEGKLRRVSVTHVDPSKEQLTQEMGRRYPLDPEAPYGAARVLRNGRTELVPEVSEDLLIELARDAEHLQMLRTLGLKSYLSTPIIVRGRTLGVLTLVGAEPGRRYGEADALLAEELALRTATAIDNARLYADARAAVRTRENVLAIVSHDLRNPLATISLCANVLAMDASGTNRGMRPEHRQQQIEAIRRATGRMVHLIGDLLDMASIQADRLSVDLRATDLVPLLHVAFDAHEALAHEAGVALRDDFSAGHAQVLCDRDRIVQALSNLLGNAIKFCSAGDTVTIGTDQQRGEAVICVSDTGPGISADDVEQIFQPYLMLEREGQRGTGLGLYITKGIVEAHGGRLWVDSTLGVGTTFFFTVPLHGNGDIPDF